MSDSSDGYRYWAFNSFSSRDGRTAAKLHYVLKTYNTPRDLVGRSSCGADGSSMEDVFRQSRNLAVSCSRNSANSLWANEDTRFFESLSYQVRIGYASGGPRKVGARGAVAIPEHLPWHRVSFRTRQASHT